VGAFTYDPTTSIGRVRRLIGDTRADTAFLDDEEIQASLDYQGTVEGAAGECLHQMAANAARVASSRTEGSERMTRSIDDTRRPEFFLAMAKQYEPFMRSRLGALTSTVGRLPSDGLSISAYPPTRRRGGM